MRPFPLHCLLLAFAVLSPAAEEAEYLPLASGHEWIMDVTVTGPDGAVSKGAARRKIGSSEKRGGKEYLRITTIIEKPLKPSNTAKLTRKDETGVYIIEASDPESKEQTEIVLPLKVGQTWKKSFEKKIFTDTVIGLESVKVQGKTYANCFHIRTTSSDGSFTEDYWEAPGIGSVKSEMVYGNGGRIVLTLREFKPGEPKTE
jgi:hypothetical protein